MQRKRLWILALGRLALLGALVAGGLLERRALALGEDERARRIARWSRRVLGVLGVRCETEGALPDGPVLVVANHVSWLDAVVLLAIAPRLRLVAKAEVRRWPLVGPLVAGAGTLFIERQSVRAAHTTTLALAELLGSGKPVGVFPEGTTTIGDGVAPLAPALFEAACRAGCPVYPVALSHDDGAGGRAAAYVDDDRFVGSLWRLCRARGLVCRVRVLAAEAASPGHRRELAVRVHRRLQAEVTCLSGARAPSGSPVPARA